MCLWETEPADPGAPSHIHAPGVSNEITKSQLSCYAQRIQLVSSTVSNASIEGFEDQLFPCIFQVGGICSGEAVSCRNVDVTSVHCTCTWHAYCNASASTLSLLDSIVHQVLACVMNKQLFAKVCLTLAMPNHPLYRSPNCPLAS